MKSKLLEIRDVGKLYPGVRALTHVSMYVNDNEVVGLVGENGAGKSTVLNVVSGIISPDEGEMVLRGIPYCPHSYHDAMLSGVSRVFQEQALVPNLRVYENMFLSLESKFSRFNFHIDRRAMIKEAGSRLGALGIEVDPRTITDTLNVSTRQMIEIAKACNIADLLGIQRPLILLDEPTAALTDNEVTIFFELIRRLKSSVSFVFVSHRLTEVLALTDRVYVLKDGALTLECGCVGLEEKALHEVMIGRARDEDYYKERRQRETSVGGRELLRVERLTVHECFQDVDLTLREGEVVGVGGVLGSGKSELGRAIAGVKEWDSGTIWVDGRNIGHETICGLMARGFGYVPQERHAEGIILNLPVSWNITLASIGDIMRRALGRIHIRREKEQVAKLIRELRIKTPSPAALAYTLSGGNQQKVVLAKWLLRKPRILILDNPTLGIDVGNKEEIYLILRDLAEHGLGIILISDDLTELIGLSNLIMVMKDGMIVSTIPAPQGAKPLEKVLVQHMV